MKKKDVNHHHSSKSRLMKRQNEERSFFLIQFHSACVLVLAMITSLQINNQVITL